MPVEPPASAWTFPLADSADDSGVVGIGADLEPGTLLAAYRSGLFPMPIETDGKMSWWSPNPRGVLRPDDLVVQRSLKRSRRRYEIRVDTDFSGVVDRCRDQNRERGWIDGQIRDAYAELHRLGWAHSVEAWDEKGLAGGLYGVSLGRLFAGESMFHHRTDASKVALTALAALYGTLENCLIDVQWCTDHLATLGATEVPRSHYLDLLPGLLTAAGPDWTNAPRT